MYIAQFVLTGIGSQLTALGEAAPVAVLAIVSLLCASLVALTIGSLSVIGSVEKFILSPSFSLRIGLGFLALACGLFALLGLLDQVFVTGADRVAPVIVYGSAMVAFVAAQLAGATRAQPQQDSVTKLAYPTPESQKKAA